MSGGWSDEWRVERDEGETLSAAYFYCFSHLFSRAAMRVSPKFFVEVTKERYIVRQTGCTLGKMGRTQLYNHMESVAERLEEITIELLSDCASSRAHLMAERRALLAEASRTWNLLQQESPPATAAGSGVDVRSWLTLIAAPPETLG